VKSACCDHEEAEWIQGHRDMVAEYVYCYECVFICFNDCLAYLLCIVYFRGIN